MLILPQIYAENLRTVQERIVRAARECGRSSDSVTLLAVSKGQPPESLAELARLGVRSFGENYLQEALPKIAALEGLALEWHFIGPLQSNKTRAIAESFAWVHTVDRLHVAERLSAQRPHHAPPLEVCLQVNLGGESAKAGALPAAIPDLALAVSTLPRLRLRGLMCLPPVESDRLRQRRWFADLRAILASLRQRGLELDTLSMGMSADLEAAIAEGATLVRVGTALFGPRPATRSGPRAAGQSG